jgi:hypothetical protein
MKRAAEAAAVCAPVTVSKRSRRRTAARRRKENFLQARPEPTKSPKFADQLKTMTAIKAEMWSGSFE